MAKFRARSKTGKNRQRWKKGQSSSSNPSKSRHRDAAKANRLRFGFGVAAASKEEPKGFENLQAPRLTAESLLKHDALLGTGSSGDQTAALDTEIQSLGQTNKTFDTFASSVWSQCSSSSFGHLLPRFNAGNAKHKEMLAILSAIAEVIKEEFESDDQEINGVQYFSALLNSLDSTDNQDSLSASVALMGVVIKTIDKELLRSKFSISSQLLLKLLEGHSESQDASIIRGLLGCLSVLLRALHVEDWSLAWTTKVMDSILTFVTDQRPKVRKAAHHAICAILASKGDLDVHPIAGHTSKFLMAKYQDQDDPKEILHLLVLLKEILPMLPKQQVKPCCEYVLQVMQTKRDRYTLSCGFQALYGLFAGRPNDKCLPAEMNAKLISALYEYQPALDDVQPSVAWLTVMQEAYINLSIQDAKLCLENVSKFFNKAIQYWTQGSDASLAATTAMKAVLLESIGNVQLLNNKRQF